MAKVNKDNNFNVSVDPTKVMHTSISTSRDGYNSARMAIKIGDDEYMSISYEWAGKKIPAFAMDLMSFMKDNEVETSGVWKGQEESYTEFSAKKKKNPFIKEKDTEDEEDTDKKDKKDKKKDSKDKKEKKK